MNTTVIIPAHNEALRIGETIDGALTIPSIERVIVVDDASNDHTALVAHEHGATVVQLAKSLGKGNALSSGVRFAEKLSPSQFYIFLDGDLGRSAEQAVLLLAPVVIGKCDMAIATFPTPARKSGFGHLLSTARRAIQKEYPTFPARAPLSGQRAFTRECLLALLPFAKGYGVEVAMTLKALDEGFAVLEVETAMRHRQLGNSLSAHAHRFKQLLDVKHTLKLVR